jgi:hypothetical protein
VLVSQVGEPHRSELVVSKTHLTMRTMFGDQNQKYGMVMRIESVDARSKPAKLKLFMESCKTIEPSPFEALVGKTFESEYEIHEPNIHLTAKVPGRSEREIRPWAGVRAPGDTSTGFEGVWHEIDPLVMSIEPESLVFKIGPRVARRFKVISWEDKPEYAKVQAICSINMPDGRLVGKRIKLLVRQQSDSYVVVHHSLESEKLDVYPEGLDITTGKELVKTVWQKESK